MKIFRPFALVLALALFAGPTVPESARSVGADFSPGLFAEVPIPAASTAVPVTGATFAAAPGDVQVSVLVVFSVDVRALLGSGPAVRTLTDQYIAEANDAFANSGSVASFAVAGAVEVDYAEPGTSIRTLEDVTLVDGTLDGVGALREQYRADVVMLLVANLTDGGGVAWIGPDPTMSVGVMRYDCGGLCFAHELGHLLGNAHDRANAATPGRTGYAYGYRVPGTLRTVMAYPCETQGEASCGQVPYFSTPLLAYGGTPLGTAEEDNVRSMNEVAAAVAGYGNSTPTFASQALSLSEPTSTSISISWGEASGASTIVGYTVRAVDLSARVWSDLVPAGTSVTVSGFTQERQYSLQVFAWDSVGRASLVGPTKIFTKGAGETATVASTTTTTTPTAPSFIGPFTDIAGSVFIDEILWLSGEGITQGCTATRFCPEDPVTRGQMAAFLTRALGLAIPATDTFTDDDGSPFEGSIEAIAAAGITLGCSPGRFCPDAAVTREQMAAFLTRALGLAIPATNTFTDDDGRLLEPEIEALAASGITLGCGPTTFCPTHSVTREQMAAFLYRALAG